MGHFSYALLQFFAFKSSLILRQLLATLSNLSPSSDCFHTSRLSTQFYSGNYCVLITSIYTNCKEILHNFLYLTNHVYLFVIEIGCSVRNQKNKRLERMIIARYIKLLGSFSDIHVVTLFCSVLYTGTTWLKIKWMKKRGKFVFHEGCQVSLIKSSK